MKSSRVGSELIVNEAFLADFWASWAQFKCLGPLPAGPKLGFRPLRAHLCHQARAAQVNIGQRQGNEGTVRILRGPGSSTCRGSCGALPRRLRRCDACVGS
jgi:hypothetical protein